MIELLLLGAFLLVLIVSVYLNVRAVKIAIAQKELENAIKGIADIEHANKIREQVQNEPMDVVRADMRKRMFKRQGKNKL